MRLQLGITLLVAALPAFACRSASSTPVEPEPPPSAAPDTLEAIRKEVGEALAEGKAPEPTQCDGWISRLEALYERDSEAYTVALLDAGRVARWCGRAGPARALYKRAATEGPPWVLAEAWLGVAQTYWLDGTRADVERALRIALRHNPKHVEARLALARILIERYESAPEGWQSKRYKYGREEPVLPEATALCLELLAEDPFNHEARVVLARAKIFATEAGPRQRIMTQTLLREILRDPESEWWGEATLVVGLTDLRSGDDNTALVHFKAALEHDPQLIEAAARAGVLLVKARDFTGGLETLALALSDPRFTNDRALLRAQASAYTQLGQIGRAQRVLLRLHDLDPSDPINDYDLANLAEVLAARAQDRVTREIHLADAALHYRAFLRQAGPEHADGRQQAQSYLDRYAHRDLKAP